MDLTERLIFRWADFPPLTELPGSGGTLRSVPEDFEVEEVPLYLPQGSGSHFYMRVQKRGLTTRDLVVALLGQGLKEQEIGVAGLKNKYALTTQWLSVPQRHAAAVSALEALEGVTVLETSHHKNKLGIGHLRGNRFSVQVRDVGPGGASAAQEVLDDLETHGVPNYFGPQRFGRFGTNAVDGHKLIRGEAVPGGHRLKRFFVSALQSLLFNHLLARRLEAGLFDRIVIGDWAKKHDTGGVFELKDAVETERAQRFEISATLPLYGKKVQVSAAAAGELEAATLAHYSVTWQDFRSRHGDRRLSRLPFSGTLTPNEAGYRLAFTLPKGAFATSVLREVMKTNVDVAEDVEEA
ncbi:tRNA pseudouridine(13) synthase TruD [soil metagenome]